MDELIGVTTQNQFDKAIKDHDIPVVRDGVWYATDRAQVTAYDRAQVTAYDRAQVTASDRAQVTAYDSAQVTATGSAQVTASDRAQVTATGRAQVTAYDSAQVTATGSAQVTAYGYVAVTSHAHTVRVTAGKHCAVIQVRPVGGLEDYLERYPIKATAKYVMLYKAVAPDMRSIHADNKIAYPAKGKIENPTLDPPEKGACANGLHFSHFDWAVSFGLIRGEFLILKARVPKRHPKTGKDNIVVSANCDGKVRCQYAEIVEVITDWQHYDPMK